MFNSPTLSSSPTTSFWDSSRPNSSSGSTTASSAEFTPLKQILLPSSSYANPALLKSLVAGLERGAGDLILLCVRNASVDAEVEAAEWLNVALKRAGEGLGQDIHKNGWTKALCDVDGKEVPYFVSQTERTSSLDACSEGSKVYSAEDCLSGETFAYAQPHQLTPTAAQIVFSAASLRCILALPSSTKQHTLYVLERPLVSFPLAVPEQKQTPWGVPALSEWYRLWAAWDLVTLGMIPHAMLHQKPIDLRHKCLFYIGHIPTFLDMLLSKALGEPNTEPKNFTEIFERGIDPHVDDPDHVHSHSEVPDADEDWPTLESILTFRDRVRARLVRLYDDLASGKRTINRNIARTLVMTHEHEGFHVETLLYMLIQRAGSGTLPPPGFTSPPWSDLSSQWAVTLPPSTHTTTLGPATVVLGHQDSEADDFVPELAGKVAGHDFGWDNESPPRAMHVAKFKIDWRPVTNGEFFEFWQSSAAVEMPKSWVEEDEEIKVRTLYGPVSLDIAWHWPVLTSYDDMVVYAHSKGGRIPTEPELRLFFDTYEIGHSGGGNVGFRNWHPVPATTGCQENGGRGSNGGVWEWTSDGFRGHEGLVPTNHFVGYSTDFFDGKHQIVLGASYATIPRLAERRTVRNFYQHNYPYPWVGARVAYDL